MSGLFADMRNGFVVACMFVVCYALAPVQWYLWIYAGSANANFYFAITLVYAAAQVSRDSDFISLIIIISNMCATTSSFG